MWNSRQYYLVKKIRWYHWENNIAKEIVIPMIKPMELIELMVSREAIESIESTLFELNSNTQHKDTHTHTYFVF